MNDEKRIGLAELISNLREELLQAQVEGDGQEIRFLVEDVELEVEVTPV